MGNRRRELTSDMKVEVIQRIQAFLHRGKPVRGAFTKTAAEVGITRQTVAYVWRKYCLTGSAASKWAQDHRLTMGTLSRHLKRGTFERRSTRIKPLLTDNNKAQRKWFNTDKDRRKTYLVPGNALSTLLEEQALAPAARNSHDRQAGTMVITPVNVNAVVFRDFIIHKVVHAIQVHTSASYFNTTIQCRMDP
ncbi:hypothetical protein H257_09854 [Aphanomyces astaci]|uniref:Transposase Tc1-like domain-containing protein n=1 Tax=Aphanomyces astaci TaxID=112090 RepID=W4G881_APHAT|nr:hypothetical protein H257_09854 [Aphanomyces astaci]ETV75885.1 hypothetical protein H257_09854 [Aphanomyces astaci]|eukprot:XP_009834527.1 hypothetical protein H257_09854 [Aphanomyces astaci]